MEMMMIAQKTRNFRHHHVRQCVQSKYGEYGGNFVIYHAHHAART